MTKYTYRCDICRLEWEIAPPAPQPAGALRFRARPGAQERNFWHVCERCADAVAAVIDDLVPRIRIRPGGGAVTIRGRRAG